MRSRYVSRCLRSLQGYRQFRVEIPLVIYYCRVYNRLHQMIRITVSCILETSQRKAPLFFRSSNKTHACITVVQDGLEIAEIESNRIDGWAHRNHRVLGSCVLGPGHEKGSLCCCSHACNTQNVNELFECNTICWTIRHIDISFRKLNFWRENIHPGMFYVFVWEKSTLMKIAKIEFWRVDGWNTEITYIYSLTFIM